MGIGGIIKPLLSSSLTALLLQFMDPPQKVSQVGIVFFVDGDGEIPQSHSCRPGGDGDFDGDGYGDGDGDNHGNGDGGDVFKETSI